ncbi:MAG: pilus assembly protein [Acidimicrobiia bacterium]|jgi:Flp pilus assembly protein TadG|nr:pilus assembly protein [Acidimicrobiia bacterium]
MTRRAAGERGSVSVELAILAPLVGILLACVVLVGRVQIARADLEGAARSAARDLSIARDPTAALATVREALDVTLEVGSPSCRTVVFTPVISATEVSVTLTCTVDLQAAAVLPVPGTMNLSATATEIVDEYRERQP